MTRSHMLVIPGPDVVIARLVLAQLLVRAPDGQWRPPPSSDASAAGYGCMTNSAPRGEANATLLFLPDDTALVPAAGSAGRRRPKELMQLLPRKVYLVASRALEPYEEVLLTTDMMM